MTTMIQDVLAYSSLGNHKDLFVRTDLNETMQNVMDDFELLIEQKGVKIEFDLPVLIAMPLQMHQLLFNLVGNSIKFAKENQPPVIQISSRNLTYQEFKKRFKSPASELSKDYFEIVFKDNGIGFNVEYKDRIFDIFQRLHNHQTYSGTGIGLALCKKIAENHHGKIYSEGGEEDGAVFHIILPARPHNE